MVRILTFIILLQTILIYSLDTVSIKLTTDLISESIRSDFASFSFEVPGIQDYIVSQTSSPKSSFIQLLNNLRWNENVAGPNLRIGGNSADTSWWDPDGKPRPPKVTYDIKSEDLVSVVNIAKMVNGSVVFDLNMLQPQDPIWAVNHLKGIETNVGFEYVRGVEIGNEPDIFSGNGIREKNYTFSQYVSEFQDYEKSLYVSGLPPKKIQGATFCCKEKSWDEGFPSYVKEFSPILASISYHRYPLSHCGGHDVTIKELLDDSSSVQQINYLKPFVSDTIALGIPFYIGEGNSVSCGGMPGVSDVFASTLWAVDFLLSLASINVKGMNFHGGMGSIYTAISYKSRNDNVPDVRPLYYAMWAFSDIVKNDAQVLNVTVETSNPLIKVWAVRSSKDVNTVVVIHKDMGSTDNASISITPSKFLRGLAQLSVLKSNTNVQAEYGISYAGLTFDNSQDGRPVGKRDTKQVSPSKTGNYNFNIQPTTIAVLVLPSS